MRAAGRQEHAPKGAPTRYHKIGHDGGAIERLFVGLFVESRTTPPREIILDLDATDDPLHGHQEGRFFPRLLRWLLLSAALYFYWTTRKSWSRRRRVVAKAESTQGEANPRFVVTSLPADYAEAAILYEAVYCARGEMENRIKECQLDLFADRTSTATLRCQPVAPVVRLLGLCPARRVAAHRPAADPVRPCLLRLKIRLKLLKIGALVTTSVRRVKIAMASGFPWQAEWAAAHARLSEAAV